jgi:hypothetical protein
VAIRSKARRFARFVARGSARTSGSICWILRATLRDGSTFAIDVCNAQYAASTPEDAFCGVFPWEQYMERLSVAKSDIIDTQVLNSSANMRLRTKLVSTLASVKAGVMAAEEKHCSADIMAMMIQEVTRGLIYRSPKSVAVEKLTLLPSSDYEKEVNNFKAVHQRCLDIVNSKIVTGGVLGMIPEEDFADV